MIRLVQCLCPNRHAIIAVPYDPEKIDVTPEEYLAEIKTTIERGTKLCLPELNYRILQPCCALCGSPSTDWTYEDKETIFATEDQAMPVIKAMEKEQRIANLIFGKF